MRRLLPLLVPAALLAGCGLDPVQDDRPIAVSVIGRPPRLADTNRRALSAPDAALIAATAQGLVRFDGAGQLEAGLAIRWDVSDDGLYYTFRLRDDARIDAEAAARRLRASLGRASANPLKPILGAIAEIVAVTPEVIELRLSAPRPNLLQLFAQPELALIARGRGSGPLRPVGRQDGALRLDPVPDTAAQAVAAGGGAEVQLRGERAALGVMRFRAGRVAVVTGGSFADLAVAQAARPSVRDLRFDPAIGLFGLQVVATGDFLRMPENRRALAMAIDRDRLVAAFGGNGWRVQTALVGAGTELAAPATPPWQALSIAARASVAAATVRTWRAAAGVARARLRVALPPGPGARLLFTLLAIDWRAIDVAAEAVPLDDASADLRLIDQVAPGDVATWYLRRFECVRAVVCSAAADQLLTAARTAPSIPERARLLAAADARLAETVPFIPLATPLRWSLVSRDLQGWRDNARAVHPLYHLRSVE